MSKNLSVQVSFLAGTHIRSAYTEARELADKLGVGVEFRFNGVLCWCRPGDDIDHRVAVFDADLERQAKRQKEKQAS